MTGMQVAGCALGAAITVDLVCVAAYYWPTTPPKPGRHSRAGVEANRFEPVETLDRFRAYCPAENRLTDHARLRLGGVLCTECRNPCETERGR